MSHLILIQPAQELRPGGTPRSSPDRQVGVTGPATAKSRSGGPTPAHETSPTYVRILWPVACALLLIALQQRFAPRLTADELQRYSRSELHMGVEFEVVLYAENPELAERALTRAMARITALDKALSDYDSESELSKLSETSTTAGRTPLSQFATVKLSEDLWTVLSFAQEISRHSIGAFDVTAGPLTKLWRRARRWKQLPEAEELAAAQASVGWQSLKLDPQKRTAQLLKPNMRLDLGGIAKGYAADAAVKVVTATGISRVLVRASGDIAAADAPPGKRGWSVGVAPLNPDDPPQRFIELANGAVSTSGDARQHLVVNGRRYSHILDPRTGAPILGRRSVTVIAPRGILADSLATAVSVLGPKKGLEMIKNLKGVELLMLSEDEARTMNVAESPGFNQFGAAPGTE